MPRDYHGPLDTNDFDDLDPDEAVAVMSAYKLLGEAFEESDVDDMLGRGWLIEVPLELVRALEERRLRAGRELHAAVRLARLQGESDFRIAEALGVSWAEFVERYGR